MFVHMTAGHSTLTTKACKIRGGTPSQNSISLSIYIYIYIYIYVLETTRSLSRALRFPQDPTEIPQGSPLDPGFRIQKSWFWTPK